MRIQAFALVAVLGLLSACAGAGRRGLEPPPPAPPVAGRVIPRDVTPPVRAEPSRSVAQPAGGKCRYCVTNDPSRRQYFDQRRARYYYFDRARKAYFWENGEPKI